MRAASTLGGVELPGAAGAAPLALVHVMTVPVSLGFLTGQAAYVRRAGFDLHAVASPGTFLRAFGEREQVTVHAVPMERRITPLKDLRALWRLWRLLRRIRPAIVHAHTPKGGLLGMIAAWLARVPVRVYHMRGAPFVTATGARRAILRRTERISCALAHEVLAVSHGLRDVAIREGICPGGKIRVLLGGSGNGVDATGRYRPQPEPVRLAARAELGIPPDALVIGFVGRLVREKGVAELAEAWRRLREEHPRLHLLVIGPEEEADALPASVLAALRADARVHLTGPDWNTPRLYAAMDVVALPTYREGFPNVPLEAAAMELPVVATAVAGCVEAVRDGVTGTLVPPRNPAALAVALRRYVSEPALRARHGAAGRRRVLAEFRQEAIWEALANEYRRLLERTPAARRPPPAKEEAPDAPRVPVTPPSPSVRRRGRGAARLEAIGADATPARARSLRVAHVITGLGSGGAQAMLYKLVVATREELGHSVVALTDGRLYGDMLQAEGVPVTYLGMPRGMPDPRAILALARALRRAAPDVVQSWMYHADLLAGVASLAAARTPVVWGVHHADVDPRNVKRLTRLTRAACARLSGVLPARIVCCAESALRAHASVGYRPDRLVMIPNGFETERFAPDPEGAARVRQELEIRPGSPIVALLARLHPDKDVPNFVAAARLVAQVREDAVFVVAGHGAEWTSEELARWIDEAGLRPRFRLLGARSDVPAILSAAAVLASSSRTEGFPQALGEAMLCGVPCAATDVGDSREIVGEAGRLVPPGDPAALGRALLELLALPAPERAALGATARERIRERYDIRAVARRYVGLYAEVARRGAG